MKTLFLTSIFILYYSISFAQFEDEEIDNLLAIALKSKDTVQINIAENLAIQRKNPLYQARANTFKGREYFKKPSSENDASINEQLRKKGKLYTEQSIAILDKSLSLTTDKKEKLKLLQERTWPRLNMAREWMIKENNYTEAVKILNKNFKDLEYIYNNRADIKKDDIIYALCLTSTNLGKFYQQAGLNSDAIEEFERSGKYAKKGTREEAWTPQNIGEVYFDQGLLTESRQYFQESLKLKDALVKDSIMLKYHNDYLNSLNFLADNYLQLEDFQNSRKFINKALQSNIKSDKIFNNKRYIETKLIEFRLLEAQDKITIKILNDARLEDKIEKESNLQDRYEYLVQLSSFLTNLGETEKALKLFDKAGAIAKSSSVDMTAFAISSANKQAENNKIIQQQKARADMLRNLSFILLGLFGISGYLFFRNFRKRKQEEALRVEQQAQFEKDKNTMLQGAYHDIRTPANKITGIAQTAFNNIGNKPAMYNYLNSIQAASRYLFNVADMILDSDKNVEDISSNVEMHDLSDLCGEAVEQIKSTRSLTIDINNEIPLSTKARFDDAHLRRVLINLISNAIKANRVQANKYRDHQGKILIRLDNNNSPKCIQVIDNGCGIVEGKVNKELKQQSKGIGLKYVKKIIELHGGSFELRDSDIEGYSGAIAQFSLQNIQIGDIVQTPIDSNIPILDTEGISKLLDNNFSEIKTIPFYDYTRLSKFIGRLQSKQKDMNTQKWLEALLRQLNNQQRGNFNKMVDQIN